MAADTYSARLGVLEMGTGNQNNSWGTSFNSSVSDVLDRAIAGSITRAVTGGTLDLSANPPPAAMRQDIDFMQIITGALTANQTIIVPGLPKTWYFYNGTTGPFQVFVQISGGNSVQIPQNTGKFVVVIASNSILRLDREHIGNFIHHAAATPPAGALACNGASLLRADYPDLFGVIGGQWGAADGTHFTLPLLTDTGRFLRSSSGSLTVGTYQSNQNKSHTHTGSGTTAGVSNDHSHTGSGTTGTMNSNTAHSHSGGPASTQNSFGGTNSGSQVSWSGGASLTGNTNIDHTHNYSFTTSGISTSHTHTYSFTTSVGSADGTEARPESVVVLICIKY